MDEPHRTRPDPTTIAVSVIGLLVVVICFAVVLTQDDATTRFIAIVTTVIIWVFLRFRRRSRR